MKTNASFALSHGAALDAPVAHANPHLEAEARSAIMVTTAKAATTPAAHTTGQRDAQVRFADGDGGRLAYEDEGDAAAPVVLCLPGLGDTRAEYRALRPGLLASGARVISADLRGHGDSDATFTSYAIVDHAADIGAVLDAAGVRRATIAANSMSAASALVFAARHPERVAGLLLLGPVTRDLPGGAWLRPLLRVLFSGPWAGLFWSAFYGSLFKREHPVDLAAHRRMLRARLASSARRRALRHSMLARKDASAAVVAAVAVPAAIVMGSADPDFPNATAEAEWLRDNLGGGGHAHLTIAPGVGHYPHLEDPALTLEAYRALRTRIEERP